MALRSTVTSVLVAGSLCVTAVAAQAATLTGRITYDFSGNMSATTSGGSIDDLTLAGSFNVVNSLSNQRLSSLVGWNTSVDVTYGSGADSLSDTDASVRGWRTNTTPDPDVIGLAETYDADTSGSLFSFASFLNFTLAGGGPDPRNMAGIPIGWDYQNVTTSGGGGTPTTITGDFTFTLTGSGNSSDFLNFFNGFSGADSSLPGNPSGDTFRLRGTVSPVPVPAALPLLMAGLGVLGLLGWRRRSRVTA